MRALLAVPLFIQSCFPPPPPNYAETVAVVTPEPGILVVAGRITGPDDPAPICEAGRMAKSLGHVWIKNLWGFRKNSIEGWVAEYEFHAAGDPNAPLPEGRTDSFKTGFQPVEAYLAQCGT